MAFTPITITGHYELADGTPASGSVDFVLTGSMKDIADKLVIVPTRTTVDLDASGEFSTTLLANNDPSTVPQNVPYQVTERIDGAPANVYQAVLPYDAPGATLDISDVTQVTGQSAVYMLVPLLGSDAPPETTTDAGSGGVSNLSSREDHVHHLGPHAVTHAAAGGDVIAPADIGAATQADLTALTAAVATKADQAATTASLAGKAAQADLTTLTATVATKEMDWSLVTANAAVAATDHQVIVADYSGGAWATGLPVPTLGAAVRVIVGVVDPAAASGTLTPNGTEVINGAIALVSAGDRVEVRSNGTDWYVVDTLAAKADQTTVDTLTTEVAAKADETATTAALAAKADQTAVDTLTTEVAARELEWVLTLHSSAYSAADHDVVVADYSAGAWATTLPAPAAGAGVEVVVEVADPGAVSGTLAPHASETIHGTVSLVAVGDKVLVRSDGTNWYVV